MKIWKEFGSSHSANVTIVGKFSDVKKAALLEEAIRDLCENFDIRECQENAESPSQAFKRKWEEKITIYGFTDDDVDIGSQTNTAVNLQGDKLTVQPGDSSNIYGIIKLLMYNEATEIKMTGPFHP